MLNTGSRKEEQLYQSDATNNIIDYRIKEAPPCMHNTPDFLLKII